MLLPILPGAVLGEPHVSISYPIRPQSKRGVSRAGAPQNCEAGVQAMGMTEERKEGTLRAGAGGQTPVSHREGTDGQPKPVRCDHKRNRRTVHGGAEANGAGIA